MRDPRDLLAHPWCPWPRRGNPWVGLATPPATSRWWPQAPVKKAWSHPGKAVEVRGRGGVRAGRAGGRLHTSRGRGEAASIYPAARTCQGARGTTEPEALVLA